MRAGRLDAAVHEAWELRRSPYFVDAVAAVLDVWDRRQLIEHELRETPLFTDCEFGTLAKLPVADLVDLIRETP